MNRRVNTLQKLLNPGEKEKRHRSCGLYKAFDKSCWAIKDNSIFVGKIAQVSMGNKGTRMI
jgi:hypothetical protein